MSIRTERVDSEIQRAVADVFRDGLRDHAFSSMVSVMGVKTSLDLKHAAVSLSFYGGGEDAAKADFEAICAAKGYIKKEAARRLRSMRVFPELHFETDGTLEYADKINRLLNDLKS